jgi:valyl-tRNA synthetase
MISEWPVYKDEWSFEAEEAVVEKVKEMVRGIRNVRAQMDVPPSRKATVYIVSEDEANREMFTKAQDVYKHLISAEHVEIRSDKEGIGEDAVSVVTSAAVLYIPLEELVDLEKEKARLQKEEEKLKKELARVNGMLNNEKFMSKAPQAKVEEERQKLAKYTQMMEQVQMRLQQMQ